jgi:hypothetical protein
MHKEAGSNENQELRVVDSSTEDDDCSSRANFLIFAIIFFIAWAPHQRRRREQEAQHDESPIDANVEVDLEAAED